MAEAQEFVDQLYGRDNIVSDRHFTVREDTEVADNFVCNNNTQYVSACRARISFTQLLDPKDL